MTQQGRFSKLEINEVQPQPLVQEDEFSEENVLERAREAFSFGLYRDSLRLYSKVININQSRIEPWVGQILAMFRLGEKKEVSVWLDRAMEKFPDCGEFWALKALLTMWEGNKKKALFFSDKSLSYEKPSSQIWFTRAELLLQARRKDWEFCLKKALEGKEEDWESLEEAGLLLLRCGKFSQSQKYLTKSLEQNPQNPFSWWKLGEAQLQLGFKKKGIKSLEQAIDLSPERKDFKEGFNQIKKSGILGKLVKLFRG